MRKSVSTALLAIGFMSFLWGMSFYFQRFPTSPDPAAGRTYSLNNHGALTYLTRREWLAQILLTFGGVAIVMIGGYLKKKRATDKRESA